MDAPKFCQQLKKAFTGTLMLVVFPSVFSFSQSSTNCADAVAQLQNYATQVNQLYVYYYWTAIPNQCPEVNAYGVVNNPTLVQYCRYQWYYQLNVWYYQQANYVNALYTQIVKGCTTQSLTENGGRPAPKVKQGAEANSKINTEEIKDLTMDVDDSKAVRITIPKTASGYRKQ